MPDREVAARLARLRQSGADLERRLPGDTREAPDSESYWRRQIEQWRQEIEATLEFHPFQLRAMQAPIPAPMEEAGRSVTALTELAERRQRLDPTIERISRDD